MLILAQAATDISSVPADYVKHFFIMVAFASGLGLFGTGVYFLRNRGSKADPVNVSQPLAIKAHPEYAPKVETAKAMTDLNGKIEAMARENLRQHNHNAEQLRQMMDAASGREERIMGAIGTMERAIAALVREEVGAVHERINPIAEKVAAHEMAIGWIKEKLAASWDVITRLQTRIDDAIRAGSRSK